MRARTTKEKRMIQRQIALTSQQYDNYRRRSTRVFSPIRPQATLLAEINAAKTPVQVASIVLNNRLCDDCDFADFDLSFTRSLATALVSVSYHFPKIRAKLGYVGSKKGFLSALQKFAVADRSVIRRYELTNVCSDRDIAAIAADGIIMIDKTHYGRTGGKGNILAEAFSLHNMIEALMLDEEDFGGSGYKKTCRDLAFGHDHPKGCEDPVSVVYHELGHLLDYLCGINGDPSFRGYYEGFSKDRIKRELSDYAATNAYEFFAEAFTEYMCSQKPREIACRVGVYLEDKYKKAKGGF